MSVGTDIIANIETVLSTTIGFNLEDLSSIDQNNWTANPLAQLLLKGETFEDALGEKPDVRTLELLVKIGFRNDDPADSRDKQYYWAHECKDNIIIDNIDTAGKNVRWVTHSGYEVDYDGTYTIIDYKLLVRYRE